MKGFIESKNTTTIAKTLLAKYRSEKDAKPRQAFQNKILDLQISFRSHLPVGNSMYSTKLPHFTRLIYVHTLIIFPQLKTQARETTNSKINTLDDTLSQA